MDNSLEQKIIQANIDLHQKEARFYDFFHPEIFCRSEQKLIRQALRKALGLIEKNGLSALDLGAGTGNITLKLCVEKKVKNIAAVDLSEGMLKQLKKKIKTCAALRLFPVDVMTFLAQDTNTYDLITISSVLHHLPDYFLTLQTVLKKLNQGGILLIFHEPTGTNSKLLKWLDKWDSRLFVNLILNKDQKNLAKSLNYYESDYQLYHGFNFKDIRKFLTDQKNCQLVYQNKHSVFKLFTLRLLARLWPWKNNFILAVKRVK